MSEKGLKSRSLRIVVLLLAGLLLTISILWLLRRRSAQPSRPDITLVEVRFRGSGSTLSNSAPQGELVQRVELSNLTPSAGRNRTVLALLIGIDRSPSYRLVGDLGGAVADMVDVEQALVSIGVPPSNIEILLNETATKAAIYRTLEVLSRVSSTEDVVIVAFAGHGGFEEHNGREGSFLLTHGEPTDAGEFLRHFGKVSAKKRLLLLDACHSGQPGRQFRFTAEDQNLVSGLAWIASCAPEQESIELKKQGIIRGIFLEEVAKCLRRADQADGNRNGALEFTELAEHVRTVVAMRAEAVGFVQTPVYNIVHWPLDQSLFSITAKWSLVVEKPIQRTRAYGLYAPEALEPGSELWLVVAPRESNGLYWPMDEPAVRLIRERRWESHVHMGNANSKGETFRVLLVNADAGLVDKFRSYIRTVRQGDNRGMSDPPIRDLPIMIETNIVRRY